MSSVNLLFWDAVDPDVCEAVTPKTLGRYQKAISGFSNLLKTKGLQIHSLDEFDVAAVLYKQHANLSKSEIDYLISSLEFHFPRINRHQSKLP